MLLPQKQREIGALRPRSSFKKRPTGWTREKVPRAYNDAPLRGIPKSLFLEKLAKKYDFPLSQQKAARWVDKYINVMLKIQTSTQKNPLLNLIKSDTKFSSKIAVFCAVEQFQKKNLKKRCSTSKVRVPFHANIAVYC